MKKRMILALMLIGVLAIGAGLGTYAWFTTKAVSKDNQLNVGTFMFEGVDENYELDLGKIFEDNLAYPKTILEARPKFIHFKNGGTLPMHLQVETELNLVDKDNNSYEYGNEFYEEFKTLAFIINRDGRNQATRSLEKAYEIDFENEVVIYEGQEIPFNNYLDEEVTNDNELSRAPRLRVAVVYCNADDFGDAMSSALSFVVDREFKPEEEVSAWISTWLNFTATNEWQGSKLTGTMTIIGNQTNYFPLPR